MPQLAHFLNRTPHYPPEVPSGPQLSTAVPCSLLPSILASFPSTSHFLSPCRNWDYLPNKSLAVKALPCGLHQTHQRRVFLPSPRDHTFCSTYWSSYPGFLQGHEKVIPTCKCDPNAFTITGLEAAPFKKLNPVPRVFVGAILFNHIALSVGPLSSRGPYQQLELLRSLSSKSYVSTHWTKQQTLYSPLHTLPDDEATEGTVRNRHTQRQPHPMNFHRL